MKGGCVMKKIPAMLAFCLLFFYAASFTSAEEGAYLMLDKNLSQTFIDREGKLIFNHKSDVGSKNDSMVPWYLVAVEKYAEISSFTRNLTVLENDYLPISVDANVNEIKISIRWRF